MTRIDTRRTIGLAALVAVLGPVRPARAQDALAERAVAILAAKCTDCHDEDGRAGLSLLSREGALKGGKSGPAVIGGDAKGSRLFQMAARTGKKPMPPDEDDALTATELEILRKWIDAGAPWPVATTKEPAQPRWWSFRKPARPAVPSATAWGRTPIDAFVARTLAAKGLRPAPELDRAAFIRRATYDLHGLPPTYAEVRAFVGDRSRDAHAKLIDRLLASPRYGEKWGRHWLDLVRYGDTSGFEQDPYLLDAWRYRDYVIESFNADKPYDRFVEEQLAGDELYPDDPDAQRGTGYFTVGPNRDMLFKVEDINRVESLTDFVDTTASVFLGLTVGCARCHDHKFDPISQKDYYRLQAIFEPLTKTRVFLHYNNARSWDIDENIRQFKLREIAEEIRVAREKKDQAALQALGARLVDMYAGYKPGPFAPGVTENGPAANDTYLPARGGGALGELVRPGFLKVLGGGEVAPAPPSAATTQRRRALAKWLTSRDHPLTARVMVNRVWQFHFGRGLVATPSDFGTRGSPPSHPELMDWLATELAGNGWSLKKLHRLIMLSSTYRQGSNPSARARDIDPDNALLSYVTRRRLGAEEIRDSVLHAAGALNLEMGGRPVVPPLAPDELFGLSMPPKSSWVVTADARQHTRRTIYTLHRRTFRQPLLEVFDAPDGVLSCPRRESSTIAPQSLSLLNAQFTREQAERFAARVAADAPTAGHAAITAAFRRALARDPTPDELTRTAAFVAAQTRNTGSHRGALVEVGRAFFNLNEFLYVD